MKKLKKGVLKFVIYMAILCLTACGAKEEEPQEIRENPTATPMVEENLPIGNEEDITYREDLEGINWDEILKVPADKAKSEANPESRMAHNVYVDPDLSATSGKFYGFMIDFKADETGRSEGHHVVLGD